MNKEKLAVMSSYVCWQAVKRAQKKTHVTLLSTAALSEAASDDTADQTASNGNVSGLILLTHTNKRLFIACFTIITRPFFDIFFLMFV